ncbi:hypothetical protein P8452_31753 [Trifolium repens]|nr:hypothetical protein P8452_31753 [Trifolium repens]
MENCRCSERTNPAFWLPRQQIRSIQNKIRFSNGFSQSLFADSMDERVSIPTSKEKLLQSYKVEKERNHGVVVDVGMCRKNEMCTTNGTKSNVYKS